MTSARYKLRHHCILGRKKEQKRGHNQVGRKSLLQEGKRKRSCTLSMVRSRSNAGSEQVSLYSVASSVGWKAEVGGFMLQCDVWPRVCSVLAVDLGVVECFVCLYVCLPVR